MINYQEFPWRLGRHNLHCVYAVLPGIEDRQSDVFLFTTGRGQETVAEHIVRIHNERLIGER